MSRFTRPTSFAGAIFVLALCLVMPGPADAAVTTMAVSFADSGLPSVSGPDITIGWRFTTAGPISVSQLGFWDDQSDGFAEQHQVAIWTTAGAGAAGDALVTTTLSAGAVDPLAPGTRFRMKTVTPVILPAGDYIIGGYLPGNQLEPFMNVGEISGFAAASGITYIERRSPQVAGFARPGTALTGVGLFGPNFGFLAVPEPSSLCLLALGSLTLLRRRRVP
jgi:hypothetical protein